MSEAHAPQAQTLVRESVREHRRGDAERAHELVNRALALDPACYEALVHRGVLLGELGRHAQALASYDAALALRPDSVHALYNRATSLQSLGRHAEALTSYERLLAHEPGDAEALNNLGVCLLEAKRPVEALSAFERALAARPDYAEALNNCGNALQRLDRHSESLACYGKSLALRPDHPQTLNNRGNALRALGRYEEAVTSFDRALALRPAYPEALCNRAEALLALGRRREALASCDRALAIRPDAGDTLYGRGRVLAAMGREAEALQCYDRALALQPGDARLLHARGRALEAQGRHREALEGYNAALEAGEGDAEMRWHRDLAARRLAAPAGLHSVLDAWSRGSSGEAARLCGEFLEASPGHVDALLLLAVLRHEQHALGDALELVRRALAADPKCHDAHVHHAALLLALRRPDEALAACESALEVRPQAASALHLRGRVLHAQERYADAVASFERALALRPRFAEALNSKGDALRALGREREALENYQRALALRPDYREALHNRAAASDAMAPSVGLEASPASADALCIRAHTLEALDRPEEALAAYERALALRPQHAEALSNLPNTLCQLGRIDEALGAFERLLRLRPDDPEAHFNSSFAYLAAGDYERGWKEYEWRWEALRGRLPPEAADKPLWLGGEDISGKTVIVYAEQGFGDAIQMARYVPLLAARGAEPVIACAPALEDLLGSVPGVRRVFSSREPPLAFDYHVPIMSLPRAFGTTFASIPSQVPYVHAPKAATSAWRARRAALGTQRKVGLAWAGNPKHKRDRARSLPVELLAPLLAAPGCVFFSLQKGDAAGSLVDLDPRGERIVDYTAELETFADTAALVSALDAVITVDTAVAHLAGALGKPVWVLLPFAPDWRWMRNRPDSPWYPSARLFRQPRPGDWKSAIDAVRAELERVAWRP
jgi:tetratricopeptide (TPR) repeat protein